MIGAVPTQRRYRATAEDVGMSHRKPADMRLVDDRVIAMHPRGRSSPQVNADR